MSAKFIVMYVLIFYHYLMTTKIHKQMMTAQIKKKQLFQFLFSFTFVWLVCRKYWVFFQYSSRCFQSFICPRTMKLNKLYIGFSQTVNIISFFQKYQNVVFLMELFHVLQYAIVIKRICRLLTCLQRENFMFFCFFLF